MIDQCVFVFVRATRARVPPMCPVCVILCVCEAMFVSTVCQKPSQCQCSVRQRVAIRVCDSCDVRVLYRNAEAM